MVIRERPSSVVPTQKDSLTKKQTNKQKKKSDFTTRKKNLFEKKLALTSLNTTVQSAGAIEYTDCISVKG